MALTTNMSDYAGEIARKVARQTEDSIVGQLSDLVKRDLLVLELGELQLVTDPYTLDIQVRQTVKLHLKNREYIEGLEKQNAELKEIIQKLKAVEI